MSGQKVSALLAKPLLASVLDRSFLQEKFSVAPSSTASPRTSVRRMIHQLSVAPRLGIANPPIRNMDYETFKQDPGSKAAVSFAYSDIHTWGRDQIDIETFQTQFNWKYPWMWRMEPKVGGYIRVNSEFSQADLEKNWYLNLKECCRHYRFNRWYNNRGPIEISVNGHVIADHFAPSVNFDHYGWGMDHIEIPKEMLKAGKNTIQIRLQGIGEVEHTLYEYAIESITLTDKPVHVWELPHNL